MAMAMTKCGIVLLRNSEGRLRPGALDKVPGNRSSSRAGCRLRREECNAAVDGRRAFVLRLLPCRGDHARSRRVAAAQPRIRGRLARRPAACRYPASSASSPTGSTCERARHRLSDRLGLPPRRPAARGHQGVRGLAAGARRRGRRRAGCCSRSCPAGARRSCCRGRSRPAQPRRRSRSAATTASAPRPVAIVEAGVIANLASCDGRWCQRHHRQFRGYIEQKKLWGVYEGEVIKKAPRASDRAQSFLATSRTTTSIC